MKTIKITQQITDEMFNPISDKLNNTGKINLWPYIGNVDISGIEITNAPTTDFEKAIASVAEMRTPTHQENVDALRNSIDAPYYVPASAKAPVKGIDGNYITYGELYSIGKEHIEGLARNHDANINDMVVDNQLEELTIRNKHLQVELGKMIDFDVQQDMKIGKLEHELENLTEHKNGLNVALGQARAEIKRLKKDKEKIYNDRSHFEESYGNALKELDLANDRLAILRLFLSKEEGRPVYERQGNRA